MKKRTTWTPEMEDAMRRLYPVTPDSGRLAERLGVRLDALQSKAHRMRLRKSGIWRDPVTGRVIVQEGPVRRLRWSPQMLSDLRRLFPVTNSDEVADILGMSRAAMNAKAYELGLVKSPSYLAREKCDRLQLARHKARRTGRANRFRKGGSYYDRVPVRCVEDGREWPTIAACARDIGRSTVAVRRSVQGGGRVAGLHIVAI